MPLKPSGLEYIGQDDTLMRDIKNFLGEFIYSPNSPDHVNKALQLLDRVSNEGNFYPARVGYDIKPRIDEADAARAKGTS